MTGIFVIVQNQVENHNLKKVKWAICRAQLSPENINFHILGSFLYWGLIHFFFLMPDLIFSFIVYVDLIHALGWPTFWSFNTVKVYLKCKGINSVPVFFTYQFFKLFLGPRSLRKLELYILYYIFPLLCIGIIKNSFCNMNYEFTSSFRKLIL